ncbi:hypothetical protein BST14_16625 [Mycobacterium arosiense ATCC BAA-1401 = DSM 45069]|uniref:Uncharacterized protein n=1 Tax=Mycobacterium arosiense ATCC BAA-1401 = DSM 45069 TaxID=1265311 RepID=A0A1W9ZE13_MYCAI|nr:hypothetical protein BST14_16625 [Mycobacterium arosiense ATCC BAA-1401 = DSM 45069]
MAPRSAFDPAAVMADAQRNEELNDCAPGDFDGALCRDVLKAMRDKLWSASIGEWHAVTKDVNFAGS